MLAGYTLELTAKHVDVRHQVDSSPFYIGVAICHETYQGWASLDPSLGKIHTYTVVLCIIIVVKL